LALTWQVAGTSDPGLKRRRNEDSLLLDEPNGIVIVADGIGGRAAGDVASAEAARAVQESLTSVESASGSGERMAEAVHKANLAVWEAAREEPEQAGMGTTVTALAIMGESWIVGHVGDSRAYLLRGGRLERLTKDHTVVQELVESGALTASAAAGHPLRHLINRAVGTAAGVEPDVFDGRVQAGDIFLLCTDGLAGLMTDVELEAALQDLTLDGLDDATASLIAEAHERGAPDNVTVGFLALHEAS
jgi:serine/threonine protein phosphatase PrpC